MAVYYLSYDRESNYSPLASIKLPTVKSYLNLTKANLTIYGLEIVLGRQKQADLYEVKASLIYTAKFQASQEMNSISKQTTSHNLVREMAQWLKPPEFGYQHP